MEQGIDFSFMGIIHQMGFLAKLVSVVLVLMSIWMVKVSIDRIITFWIANRDSAKAARESFDRFGDGTMEDAAAAVRKYPRGHLGRVILGALSSFGNPAQ